MFPRLHCCLSHQTPGTYLTHPPPPCVTPQSPRNCASCKQPMYHLANYDIPIPCLLPPTAARHDLDARWCGVKKYILISRLPWLFMYPFPVFSGCCLFMYRAKPLAPYRHRVCGAPTKQPCVLQSAYMTSTSCTGSTRLHCVFTGH